MSKSKIKTVLVHGLTARVRDVWVETEDGPSLIRAGEFGSLFVEQDDVRWKEIQVRVRSALTEANPPSRYKSRTAFVYGIPAGKDARVTVMDLPVAIAVAGARSALEFTETRRIAAVGELSLGGEVRPVPGILPMMLAAAREGVEVMLIPDANANETLWLPKDFPMKVVPVSSLWDALKFMCGEYDSVPMGESKYPDPDEPPRMDEVRGQDKAKAEIKQAIADGKSILLVGPPGAGKTMLARRIYEFLPEMTEDMARESACIVSATGLMRRDASPKSMRRPFRAPHHTVSTAGLVGGGTQPRAGEVSLAHNGVLFLDEADEFSREALEKVADARKREHVNLFRNERLYQMPSKFVLIGGVTTRPAPVMTGGVVETREHPRKALLDALFDVTIEVPAVRLEDL